MWQLVRARLVGIHHSRFLLRIQNSRLHCAFHVGNGTSLLELTTAASTTTTATAFNIICAIGAL